MTPPSRHPMDILRTAVSMLANWDPETEHNCHDANRRKAERLVAQLPTVLADRHRIRSGLPILSTDPSFAFPPTSCGWYAAPRRRLDQAAMDVLMVLHADHELNASTFAARVVASTLADMHGSVTGALAALKGPLHGGANQRVMEMSWKSPMSAAEAYIDAKLARKERVMGFGHRVYSRGPPRRASAATTPSCWRACNSRIVRDIAASEEIVVGQKGILRTWTSTRPPSIMPGHPRRAYFTPIFAGAHGRLDRPRPGAVFGQSTDPPDVHLCRRDGHTVRANRSAEGVTREDSPRRHRDHGVFILSVLRALRVSVVLFQCISADVVPIPCR